MYKWKGQSAIEYLMTYGWMLLVVAVVGGAVFSFTGDQGVESVNGFSGDDVEVSDFGLNTAGGLDIVLRNAASEEVTVNRVNVSDEGGDWSSWSGVREIGVSDTGSVALANVSESSGSSSLDVSVGYDVGGLEGLESSGVITGGFEITGSGSSTGDTPEPLTSNDFEVNQK